MIRNIQKGSKIKKFPTTPQRTGYTFKGWYTKKTGGKKIAVSTKPTKSVIIYAQWKKKSSTSANSKIVGHWQRKFMEYDYNGIHTLTSRDYYFFKNGKFQLFVSGWTLVKYEGKYSVSNGKVHLKEIKWTGCSISKIKENLVKYKEDHQKYQFDHAPVQVQFVKTSEYRFGSDKNGNYLEIYAYIDNPTFLDISYASKFRKMPK